MMCRPPTLSTFQYILYRTITHLRTIYLLTRLYLAELAWGASVIHPMVHYTTVYLYQVVPHQCRTAGLLVCQMKDLETYSTYLNFH